MRLLRGACPERHEILPLPLKGQNDNRIKGLKGANYIG